ncbi:hypothetical protein CCR94_18600 [Rhodoblastus sphagnicola]|uniref:Uncharacterized protein n=1 Tax=Rhodoblastus sphagnicola TaxID=333368 RepID=A0A2S6N0M8_9HYPH|nr:hypothetical protein CCR94_18600 [Rhodoblastus sphagnicola]
MVAERTALINQVRAVLLERGIVVPQGKRALDQYLRSLTDESGEPPSQSHAKIRTSQAIWES